MPRGSAGGLSFSARSRAMGGGWGAAGGDGGGAQEGPWDGACCGVDGVLDREGGSRPSHLFAARNTNLMTTIMGISGIYSKDSNQRNHSIYTNPFNYFNYLTYFHQVNQSNHIKCTNHSNCPS